MSRYEIPARQPGDTVFVGWDHPLLTFFGQVYRDGLDEDENPFVWVGAERPQEIYEVDQLKLLIGPYASISYEMQVKLHGDRDEGR